MARGWESKSVEQQQADAVSDKSQKRALQTPQQLERERKRQTIQLARQQILQQLAAARHPRHRDILQAALADLDAQLLSLG